MFSKRELKQFLEEISENAAFVKFQFGSTDKFMVQLKCKVDGDLTTERYNKYASEWIKKFAKFTATTWIVRNSFPRLKRLLYRKVFSCHRSSFNKKKQCTGETRNQGCRAKIDFKMKFINRNTIKNDPLLKEGLNMTISIDFLHSHKLRTQEAFNMLKSTPETDTMFYGYFDNGYSPSMAKLYHELTVIDRYGDCPQNLMNAKINPTVRHVQYLHGKTKKAGDNNSKPFDVIMSSKKATLESAGGFLNYDNPELVTVITPTMRRVLLALSLEHILVDSIPIVNGVVTFLYAVSKAGALPIACVLHTEETEANYSQVFLSVKLTVENLLNGQFEPKLLNIKDLKEMRDAATSLFPNSVVLSSKWSVSSNIWQWICSDNIKMEGKMRHIHMENFWDMIRCNNLVLAESCYESFKDNDNENPSEVIDYVEDLWYRRVHWLNGEDNVSLNVVEASMRVMNEFVNQKCKSFNVQVMVDVLFNIVDNQIRRILHAHVKSSNVLSTYTKFLDKTKEIMNLDSTLKRVDSTEFKLESGLKTKKYVKFRIDTWCCDCAVGKKGRFCEHLCAIINVNDTDLMKTTEMTDEEKCLLTDIAGKELEEKSLVKPEVNEEGEMDIDGVKEDDDRDDDDEADDVEVDRYLMSSPKSEADDGYYYLDVKAESFEGNDPLDEATDVNNEEKCEEISFSPQNNSEGPSTSRVDLKSKYEGAMKTLNNEFRRLNKYFKANPNRSNMDTMVRLARELGKIRPIERVDLGNMHVELNRQEEDYS